MVLIDNFIQLMLEASPWLLLGLLIAGLMKAWLPSQILAKHLGSGNSAIIKAAIIGAPLPLCSCGVIPVATELRRSGASPSATSSFLVATPETGVDSISVSYAMLGPVFAIYRPITAVLSAIFTGLWVKSAKPHQADSHSNASSSCCGTHEVVTELEPKPKSQAETSCCSSKQTPKTLNAFEKPAKVFAMH